MPTIIAGAAGLHAAVGADLGATPWKTLPFEQIRLFADATGDHQWIHVDKERIAKESPFGAPIAHGYLTLSTIAGLFFELLDLQGFKMVINYGTNKVRFPTPVKAESRTRMSLKLTSVTPVGADWLEAIFVATIEVEGSAKPGCVAECVFRFQPA
jgi:acyl dehydratase